MENRALEQFLREIENQANLKKGQSISNNKSGGWPPDKYKHIKGTGYGTSWTPGNASQQPKNLDLSHTIQRSLKKTHTKSNSNFANNESNSQSTLIDDQTQNYILNLRSKKFYIFQN